MTIVLVAIVTGTAVALVLRWQGLETVANIAQLVTVIVPAVVFLYRWWRDTRPSLVATPDDIARAKTQLSTLLLTQWREEARLRALDDPDPIPIIWRMTDREELIDRPSNRTANLLLSASSKDVASLVAEFRRLGRPRLVILGDAGAGKTTLAVQILLELLHTRAPTEPVPVLLSLAGWDVGSQGLREWVATRIVHDHPSLATAGLGTHVIRALTELNHILPILDGLDEMPEAAHELVIEALHRAMDDKTQLVLTSRTEAYRVALESAGRVLRSAAVVEPEPVTPAVAANYLESCLPPVASPAWDSILERLRNEPESNESIAALASVASSPLGLWLIRMAYISPNTDPGPILDSAQFDGVTDVRTHLFDQLIGASIKARPPSENPSDPFRPRNQYDPADVDRWLRFLAANLDNWETRDFDWTTDTAKLTKPARWPTTIENFVIVVGRLLAPAVPSAVQVGRDIMDWFDNARRVPRLAVVVGAIVWPLFVLASVGRIPHVGGLFAVYWLMPIVLVFGALVVMASIFNPETGSAEPDRLTDRIGGEISRYRNPVLALPRRTMPGLLFVLTYAATIGVITGVGTSLAFGQRQGLVVGALGAVASGVLAGLYFYEDAAPGAGEDRPWYGMTTRVAIHAAFRLAVGLGISGLLVVWVTSDDHSPNIVDIHAPAWIGASLVVVIAVSAVLLVAFAVLLPIAFGLARLATLLLGSIALPHLPESRNARPDSLELWNTERHGQKLRFIHAAFMTLLITAAVVGLCLAVRETAEWSQFQHEGFAGWLESRLFDGQLHWSGQLRYGFAVVLAWLLTIRESGPRTWKRWLVWLAIAAAVVVFWPGFARPDNFDLHLVSRFDGLDATFDLFAHASLGKLSGSSHGTTSVDLALFIADGGVRTFFLLLAGMVGLNILSTFLSVTDSEQSRVWWSTRISTFWHTVRGRLPADLLVFLDDAHRLGLLRAVGTSYQFRHAEFQDHLARTSARTPRIPAPRAAAEASGTAGAVALAEQPGQVDAVEEASDDLDRQDASQRGEPR